MTRRLVLSLVIVCSLSLLSGAGVPGLAAAVQAQGPKSDGVTLPYAGRLNGPDGRPADGLYDFTFGLYEAQSGGAPLWQEAQMGVPVKGGDVQTALGSVNKIPSALVTAKLLWLEVSVRGPGETGFTLLNPRQAMVPGTPSTPGALTCPHSHFTDYWYGTSDSYGVDVDNTSGDGDGLRAYSGSTLYNWAAIYAVNSGGTDPGAGGSAVYGTSVNGYAGYFYGANFRGIYVSSNLDWYAAYIDNRGGATSPGMYVDGTLWVTGAKNGYVVDTALNDGPEALETGDVVVVTGAAAPLAGENPVIRVRKAGAANSPAVAGIVDRAVVMQQGPQDAKAVPGVVPNEARLADGTAIQPGQYLVIVTLGSYKGVKVDATRGPIRAGDLLVASPTPGLVMASADPRMGTVVGKALGDLLKGTGVVPVLVTLK